MFYQYPFYMYYLYEILRHKKLNSDAFQEAYQFSQ